MRYFFFLLIALGLCGCGVFGTKAEQGYSENNNWDTAAAYTTADVRIILQRNQPVLGNPVVCVEPAPDVADALSHAAAITASGGNTTVKGDLSVSGSTSDAIAELAGRSTALLGLRDGLFRACEAYANGAIGQDVYSLIVSRYSGLMTTLFLGQDISSAAVGQARASANSMTPATTPNAGATTTAAGSKTGGAQAEAAPPASQSPALVASASPEALATPVSGTAPPMAELIPLATPAEVWKAANAGGAAGGGAGGAGKTPISPTPAPAPKPTPTPTPTPTPAPVGQSAPASGGAASTAAALALTRMNEDYMHQGLLGALLVACINENDPTRMSETTTGKSLGHNDWLNAICFQLDLGHLEGLYTIEQKYEWTPVNPAEAAGPGTTKPGGSQGTTPAANATIKSLQLALIKAGYDPGPADGVSGPKTAAALQMYETNNGLSP